MIGKNQEYFNSAKEFNEIFFHVVDVIEINNDVKSLEALQSKENTKNIERLGILLQNIKKTVPDDREPIIYNFEDRYNDLVFLRDSYVRYSELSKEERRRLNMAIVNINVYKNDWNDKKSTTVWE